MPERSAAAGFEPGIESLLAQLNDVCALLGDVYFEARGDEPKGLAPGYVRELISTAGDASAEKLRDRLVGAFDSNRSGQPLEHDASLIVVKAV